MDSVLEDEQLTRPPWGEFARVITLTAVWAAGKLVVQGLNSTTLSDADVLERAMVERPPGTPLITVCNHTRCSVWH